MIILRLLITMPGDNKQVWSGGLTSNTKINLVYMSDCADETSERKWFDVELQLQFEHVTL